MLGIKEDLDTFRRDPAAAKAFVGVEVSASDSTVDVGELAAWMMTANLMLNLDEVIMKN